MNAEARAHRTSVVLALLAIYLIWGSTYLAILEAIHTIPPLAMGSIRFVAAGLPLLLWVRWKQGAWPGRAALGWAALAGVLMFAGGNGAVVWAEKTVPSGLAALIVASVSFWTVLLEAVRPGGQRPSLSIWLGIALGFTGLAVLIGPDAWHGIGPVPLLGASVLVIGSLSWAIGTLVSVATVKRGLAAGLGLSALQMLFGGIGLGVAAALHGEWGVLDLAAVSLRSWLAVIYLVVAGSLVAFTAYNWLLSHTSPAVATTYAYVNPLVAMLLGWLFVSEPFTPRIAVAATLILGAVAMIMRAKTKTPRSAAAVAQTSPAAAAVREVS